MPVTCSNVFSSSLQLERLSTVSSHGGPSFTMTADSCTHSTATAEFIPFLIDGIRRLSRTPHGQQYLPTWDNFGVFVTGHETVCFKTIMKHTYTRQCFSPKWWHPGEVEFWNTHSFKKRFEEHRKMKKVSLMDWCPLRPRPTRGYSGSAEPGK